MEGHKEIRHAIDNGSITEVGRLIEFGADITVKNNWAVQRASENGHTNMVQLLIDHGANITDATNGAIKRAIENGHIDTMTLLIYHGAGITDFLYLGLTTGNIEIMKITITAAVKHAVRSKFNHTIALSHTHIANRALITLIRNNDIKGVLFAASLIKMFRVLYDSAPVIFNEKLKYGRIDDKALVIASEKGYNKIIQILIDIGIDVAENKNGAVLAASKYMRNSTVQLLVDNGADVTARNNEAILTARKYNRNDTVKLLIDNGADATVRNEEMDCVFKFPSV